MTEKQPYLVLASASPRRKDLLESMGVKFEIFVSNIDESILGDETPQQYVSRLAQEKAKAALQVLAHRDKQPSAILAADTIVSQGSEIFSKPRDQGDAFQIWRQLSDSEHQVITAVALLAHGKLELRVATTKVRFGPITEQQMLRYWQSGEPLDKAGAYAIQGYASAWVQQINGSYSNVVGLPLYEVNDLLTAINANWL